MKFAKKKFIYHCTSRIKYVAALPGKLEVLIWWKLQCAPRNA